MNSGKQNRDTFEDKLKVLNSALATSSKGLLLKHTLARKKESTKDVEAKLEKLDGRIVKLRGRLHDQWQASAKEIRGQISSANGNLQKCITNIEKAVEIAQHVIKALGYIDKVIELLLKVV